MTKLWGLSSDLRWLRANKQQTWNLRLCCCSKGRQRAGDLSSQNIMAKATLNLTDLISCPRKSPGLHTGHCHWDIWVCWTWCWWPWCADGALPMVHMKGMEQTKCAPAPQEITLPAFKLYHQPLLFTPHEHPLNPLNTFSAVNTLP